MSITKTLYSSLLLTISLSFSVPCMAQDRHSPVGSSDKPDNIILFIGDGMGLAHIYAGLTVNQGYLNLLAFKNIGFSKTHSASHYITDSGAGATAISIGEKTYNGAIGVNADTVACHSILEYAEHHGLSTGLVSTSAITHATPASFIAHNINRNNYEEIAADFLKTDIDVFIGGGRNHFAMRHDHRNLIQELRDKDYQVVFTTDSIKTVSRGKLAALTAPENNPGIIEGRKDFLPAATQTALNILDNNHKGFFLMVEGSHIDFGGHGNNTEYVAREVIDFDKAIGLALEFAQKNKKTLVIVTADHETGAMSIIGGDLEQGKVTALFGSTNHTGIMVPLFAYGPGAELFQGIQENTEIFDKMMKLLGLIPQECSPKP